MVATDPHAGSKQLPPTHHRGRGAQLPHCGALCDRHVVEHAEPTDDNAHHEQLPEIHPGQELRQVVLVLLGETRQPGELRGQRPQPSRDRQPEQCSGQGRRRPDRDAVGHVQHHEHDRRTPDQRNDDARFASDEGGQHETDEHHPGEPEPQQREQPLPARHRQHHDDEQHGQCPQHRKPVDRRVRPADPVAGVDTVDLHHVPGLQSGLRLWAEQRDLHRRARIHTGVDGGRRRQAFRLPHLLGVAAVLDVGDRCGLVGQVLGVVGLLHHGGEVLARRPQPDQPGHRQDPKHRQETDQDVACHPVHANVFQFLRRMRM